MLIVIWAIYGLMLFKEGFIYGLEYGLDWNHKLLWSSLRSAWKQTFFILAEYDQADRVQWGNP